MCRSFVSFQRFTRLAVRIAAIAALGWFGTNLSFNVTPAAAQDETVSVEFRTALEPYGSFRHVDRWGEVWVPGNVPRDWRPYTVGRWVYSGDYGWYWVSDGDEAPWGWVAFHYGRWVWIDDVGWAWVPGREWGPAWVNWRRGGEYVGWAPLPPDDIVVDVRDNPQYWIFVRPRDFLTPRIETVFIRPEPVFFRDTVVVNETVPIRERGFAVNPGIEPAYLAAEVGRPVPEFQVRPRVIAGTARLPDALEVRADDLRRQDFRRNLVQESNIRETSNVVQPARSVPQPQPLAPNERGRLGQNPPRAAAGVVQQTPQPGTTGTEQQRGPNQRGATGQTSPEQQRGLNERGATGQTSPEQQRGLNQRGTTGQTTTEQQRGPNQRGATGQTTPEQQRGLNQRGATSPTTPEQRNQRGAAGSTPEQQRGRGLYDRANPGAPLPRGPQERGTSGPNTSEQQRGLNQRGANSPRPEQQRGRGLYDRATPNAVPQRGSQERGATGPSPELQRGPQRGAVGAAPEERGMREQRGAAGPAQAGRGLYDRAAPSPAAPERELQRQPGGGAGGAERGMRARGGGGPQ